MTSVGADGANGRTEAATGSGVAKWCVDDAPDIWLEFEDAEEIVEC